MSFLLSLYYNISMLKAIIFDFDYTLSDRSFSIYNGFRSIVLKYFSDLDPMHQEAIIQRMLYLDEEGTISRDHIIDFIASKYDIDKNSLKEDFKDLSLKMAKDTTLDEDALKVLDYLKNNTDYKLAILTNGIIESQRLKIKTVGIESYFEKIVVSIESGYNKPDKRAFEYVAKELDVTPCECLFVGDVMFNDLLGAYDAGMKYLLLNNHRKHYYASFIPKIEHLRELIDYLRRTDL